MKRTLIFFLIISNNLFSQNFSCEDKVSKHLIDKVEKHESINLIPYFSKTENKWGFFDKKTRKIVTSPILNRVHFFKPNLRLFYEMNNGNQENGCDANILGSKENYKTEFIKQSDYQVYEVESETRPKINYEKLINDEISGFEVNDNNKIIGFNSKFYNKKTKKSILKIWAIKFKNNYYAVVTEKINDKNKYSIVNQQGDEMEGFENLSNFPIKVFHYRDSDDIWFYFKTEAGKYKFRSLLKNKEINGLFDRPLNLNNYAKTIGFAILKTNAKYGLLDLTTMSWRLKPKKKNDFVSLNYSSSEVLSENYINDRNNINFNKEIPIEIIKQNRLKSNVYIQNSKREFYNLKRKIIKPKK